MDGQRLEPPCTWAELDRDSLSRLLESGLTPSEVGALFGRNCDAVRKLVRRWGLDSRALRAHAIGLAARHPGVAAEFVRVVSGAPLHYGPEDLLAGSGARCRWRCAECTHEWTASVTNRTTHGSGCPACAADRAVERARVRKVRSAPLAEVAPELENEFRRNVSRPDRGFRTTPSGSHDRVLWQCRSGHEWETEARQRIKWRTQCPTCLAGLWSSRLEFQVAELVSLATGMQVTVGDRRPRSDRAATDNVDLLVVDADVRFDLDPSRGMPTRWPSNGTSASSSDSEANATSGSAPWISASSLPLQSNRANRSSSRLEKRTTPGYGRQR